jgi:protein involved in polysaccharide export with SLBB domain
MCKGTKSLNRYLGIGLSVVLMFALPISARSQGAVQDSLQLIYRYYDRPVDPYIYMVRPGEKITVTFLGAKLSALGLSVNAEGRIAHPNIGVLDAAGLTLAQLKEQLAQRLAGKYTPDELEISVGDPFRTAISVTGDVRNPGTYIAYTSQFVSELIEMAGGLTGAASTRYIELKGGPGAVPVDLEKATYLGDVTSDPCVYGGYTIHVPPRSDSLVNILGQVRMPRQVEFVSGESVQDLLTLAGGVTRWADPDNIKLLQPNGTELTGSESVDPGCMLIVPAREGSDKEATVAVFGAVGRPGIYRRLPGSSLSELVASAGGLTDSANGARITVFRKADEEYAAAEPERFPIRVGLNTNGYAEFAVTPGDSVFVPKVLGFVRVTGEVRKPGLLPYTPGMTASACIRLAGGFLSDAVKDRVVVSDRVSGLSFEVGPEVEVGDGDEILVQRREIEQ